MNHFIETLKDEALNNDEALQDEAKNWGGGGTVPYIWFWCGEKPHPK